MEKNLNIPYSPRSFTLTACLLSAAVWLAPAAVGQGWQADGLYWQSIGTSGGALTAGAASSATNAYFGGSGNRLVHYNGSTLNTNPHGWNQFAAGAGWNGGSVLNVAIDHLGNPHVAGADGWYAYYNGAQWNGLQLIPDLAPSTALMRDGFWIDSTTGTSYIAGWSGTTPPGTDSSEVFRLSDDGFGGYFVQSLSTGYTGGRTQTVGAITGTGLDDIWIASTQGAPRHSTDGGNTWSTPITSVPFNPSRASMVDGNTVVYGTFANEATSVAIWDGNADPTEIVALAEQPGHASSRIYATGEDSIWAFRQSWINNPNGPDIQAQLSFYDGESWNSISFGDSEGQEYRFMTGADGVVFVTPTNSNDIYMGMIPEPGTWALLMGISVLGLSVLVRRRRSRA